MAHNVSQQSIANLLKRRNASLIPKDQQKILDQPGSWAVELNNESKLRVPGHVLQTATNIAKGSRKRISIEADLTLPEVRQSLETNDISKDIPDSSLRSHLGNATPERFVSWTPSPAPSPKGVQRHSLSPSSIRDGASCRNESPLPSLGRDFNSSHLSSPQRSQASLLDEPLSQPRIEHSRAEFLKAHLTETWKGNDWLPPGHRERPHLTLNIRILAALCRVTEIAKLNDIPLRSLWSRGAHLHSLSKGWPDVEDQCLHIVRSMETEYGIARKEASHVDSQADVSDGHEEENFTPQITKQSIASRYIAMNIDFPSSGPEDALETQLPQAQIISQAPINRVATTPRLSNKSSSSAHIPATLNTPPCAQPSQRIIPATVRRDRSPPPDGPTEPGKKRRRMKPIEFSDSVDQENIPMGESSRNSNTFARMAPTKTYPQISSSNSMSSSIIVPATIPQSPSAQRNSPQRRSRKTSASETHNQRPTSQSDHPYSTPKDKSDAMEITVPPTIGQLAPFELFTQAYPSYESQYRGSIWSFVRACICLDYLMKSNSLREYLWDDFIRAFSAEYLEYVENANEPLPALDWFNTLTGAPVFTHILVKRDTIRDILNSYPDEVRKAKVYTKEGRKNKSSGSDQGESDDEDKGSSKPPQASPQKSYSPRHDLKNSRTIVEIVPSTSVDGEDGQTKPISRGSPELELPSPTTASQMDRDAGEPDEPQVEAVVLNTASVEYPTQVNTFHRPPNPHYPPVPSSARSTATRSSTGTRRGSSYLQRLASSPKDSDAKRRERLRQHFMRNKLASTPRSG